ncbi:hypothetical protein QVD17_07801 [Tagetes erecta]|uniref:RING-type E3 ubiquitin transferase n=1 Tax=Tagetes erecta TaxID=13708 RepID=A0AAD8P3Y9_TARER|nr:hypothetical protein QVD17_07801 [Tagetes erecta]
MSHDISLLISCFFRASYIPLTIQNPIFISPPNSLLSHLTTVMAATAPPSPPPPPPPLTSNAPDPNRYWCYHCNKRVITETLPDHHPDIICFECKNGFVESISLSSEHTPAFGNEFVHVLRMIAQAARDDDAPPPPPPPASDRHGGDNDYLRIELDGWGNSNYSNYVVTDEEDQEHRDQVSTRLFHEHDDDDDDDNDNENEEDIDNNEIENRTEEEEDDDEQIENRNDLQIEDEDEADFGRREHQRRGVLRFRLREVANRAANRHNRILDWAEMLMGLENQSIDFRLQVTGDDDEDDDEDDDGYIGNPGDYVDAAGYEALIQTLAEGDSNGRRGAPPAAKNAVANLQTVEIKSTDVKICAVCKEKLFIAKKLECGHLYHGECIVPWLSSRNSCPVCRFELPTDDPEYEEERKRRLVMVAVAALDEQGCSSSSGGDGG